MGCKIWTESQTYGLKIILLSFSWSLRGKKDGQQQKLLFLIRFWLSHFLSQHKKPAQSSLTVGEFRAFASLPNR